MELIRERFVNTRAIHHCEECGWAINKGRLAVFRVMKDHENVRLKNTWMHVSCFNHVGSIEKLEAQS